MSLALAAAITVLAGAPAGPPVAVAAVDAACHASVDDAAIQALTLALSLEPSVEHGGAIYERGAGCFVFSEPVSIGKPSRVEYKVLTSPSVRLAGLYHTHPEGCADAFSGEDVLQARASKVPSFVAAHGSGHIRKLRPGYLDYSPTQLMDRDRLLRSGVKGRVLTRLPA